MLRIIHTSDIHLGSKFASLGKKADAQRQALKDSLAKVVDHAVASKASLVLITGDLFDSNFPSPQSVSFVRAQLARLNEARIWTMILPGTHDCLSKGSVYVREDFSHNLSYVYVFNDTAVFTKEIPDIDATIYAKPSGTNKSTESPVAFLASATKSATTQYKIAMAHGSVQIEGKSAPDDMPITLREVAESGVQYLALGHWHGAQEFSFGNTIAWYAGSPEVTYQEGKGGIGQGYALEVDVMETAKVYPHTQETISASSSGSGLLSVGVKPVKISEKIVREVDIDMQIYENVENVVYELEKLADLNCLLLVNVFGFAESAVFVDPEHIMQELEDKFFSIKVKSTTALKLPEVTALNYPEELVIGQFVRIMQKKLEEAQTPQEHKMIENALQIGIAELEGKNVLSE
ncbi:MAG: DNA repair exonuclease [Candidatus Azambacteria bacterium]|nr:DNA repair exonuclease [Candidatus Azambacteria bacterium]